MTTWQIRKKENFKLMVMLLFFGILSQNHDVIGIQSMVKLIACALYYSGTGSHSLTSCEMCLLCYWLGG